MVPTQETIAVQTRLQGAPCLVASGTILLVLQNTLLDAPRHAIEEEGCSCHFRGRIVDIRYQTGMPESIGMLTLQQAFAHQDEVLLQGFVFLALGREVVHTANQGCIDPAVATTPIAILAIFLLIGRYIVLVAPPESFLHIEATTPEGVARPVVTLHGVVEIFLVFRDGIHLYIYGHGHLDGINPCPVVDAVGTYLIVQILTGQVQ